MKQRPMMKIVSLWLTDLVVGLALMGCQSFDKQTTEAPYYNYRAELQFDFGSRRYEGFAVTKVGDEGLEVGITSPIALNRVEISTCSRHEVIRNTASGWFDKVKNTMAYRYVPSAAEREGQCPLLIRAFNDHVQKAWGMVSFRSHQTLPAKFSCNGQDWTYSGLSMCQTKAGLEERITFDRAVEFEATDLCQIATDDKKTFRVRNKGVGFCKAVFSDGELFHDMTLLGYDQVIVY